MAHPVPSEIITEILYRLPAKSVGRFRCVSKSWLSLLTDPQFIKTHQITLNRNQLIIFSRNGRSLYSLPFHQTHVQEEATLSTPTKLRLDLYRNDIIVDGCCNGLVLLFYSRMNHPLAVLNPTTCESVLLPDLNYQMKNLDDYKDSFMVGFGYDSVTDDYKVVVLIQPEDPAADVFVDVYSLQNNTWKNSVIHYPFYFCPVMRLSDAFVNGCLHWLATKGPDGEVPVIVAFSLKDDNFTQIALPNMGIDVDVICDCKLASIGGKLVVFVFEKGEIWLMKEYGVKESWTKILLHGFIDIPTDVLPMVFDVHGKILLVRGRKMWIYNLEDGSLCKDVDTSRYLDGLYVEGVCVQSIVPLPKVQLDESADSSEVDDD